ELERAGSGQHRGGLVLERLTRRQAKNRPNPLPPAQKRVTKRLLQLTELIGERQARELGVDELTELVGGPHVGPAWRARSISAGISLLRSARLCSTSTARSGSPSVASSCVRARSSRSISSSKRATDSGSCVLTVSPPLRPCRGFRSRALQRPPTNSVAQGERPRRSTPRAVPRRDRARRARCGGCCARVRGAPRAARG